MTTRIQNPNKTGSGFLALNSTYLCLTGLIICIQDKLEPRGSLVKVQPVAGSLEKNKNKNKLFSVISIFLIYLHFCTRGI